ncbi:MAG TPA: VWA domain-containing protein, partial [Pyrinomonadaceae bacterium]|nr:VWA domain-containing protein [Pyrinomonadaceae bacterium]
MRIRTDLVTVPVIVTDQRGRRISGLTAADFSVRDDGRAVNVEYFAAGAERVALLFALDASGSTREIIARQRETALALFSRFGMGSRVAVLHFGETAEFSTPFTTNVSQTRPAFSLTALPGRRTAIFDAAATAVRAFDTQGGDRAERCIVILISDGLDTTSTVRAKEVIVEALARVVSIYVIHLPLFTPRDGRLLPRPAAKGFRELAEKTGGHYFMVAGRGAATEGAGARLPGRTRRYRRADRTGARNRLEADRRRDLGGAGRAGRGGASRRSRARLGGRS